ncbi:MAG: ATP-binding protein, partial [Nitrososphaerota archaeon]
MAECSRCGRSGEALYKLTNLPGLICKDCFITYYEKKVKNCVIKYEMLRGVKNIGVAVSGGKDSMALARVLSRLFPDIHLKLIHINLGIPSYSNECQKIVEKFADENSIDLIIYNIRELEGYSIDSFSKLPYVKRMCGVCGIVKRYLMNKIAYENRLDALATGHNLDDTVETLFKSYLKGDIEEIVRIRPLLPSTHPKLVKKIKPLIEMTERENLLYVTLTNTMHVDVKCPFFKDSRMMKRKKLISMLEEEIKNFKYIFFKSHLKKIQPVLSKVIVEPALRECKVCG